MDIDNLIFIEDGGPGSGNFGHSGRPGKVGGSATGANKALKITAAHAKGWNDFKKANPENAKKMEDAFKSDPKGAKKFFNSLGFKVGAGLLTVGIGVGIYAAYSEFTRGQSAFDDSGNSIDHLERRGAVKEGLAKGSLVSVGHVGSKHVEQGYMQAYDVMAQGFKPIVGEDFNPKPVYMTDPKTGTQFLSEDWDGASMSNKLSFTVAGKNMSIPLPAGIAKNSVNSLQLESGIYERQGSGKPGMFTKFSGDVGRMYYTEKITATSKKDGKLIAILDTSKGGRPVGKTTGNKFSWGVNWVSPSKKQLAKQGLTPKEWNKMIDPSNLSVKKERTFEYPAAAKAWAKAYKEAGYKNVSVVGNTLIYISE
jgi:hypothetical protein